MIEWRKCPILWIISASKTETTGSIMEIKINGNTADITLDNEKTVGEIIASLEQWLANSGHRLSGLSIDGQNADVLKIDDFFVRDIDTINTIDIYTSSLSQLTAESMAALYDDAQKFKTLGFEEKKFFFNDWKNSPQAAFTNEQMPELYSLFVNSFSGGDINPETLISITEERIREINDPVLEFSNLQKITEETCSRLNDLALDIQTGKDLHAAQTIQIFSSVSEKILRVLRQIDIQGYLSQKANDDKSVDALITEFGKLVKELLEAYEKHDTVLVGDIAEYEASVKLKELFNAILNKCEPIAGKK
jgi:molybdopterin converting factor small subunit